MNKLSDQFILMSAVAVCALALALTISVLKLTSQLDLLGLAAGAAYLIISIQSYAFYAGLVLEKRRTALPFIALITLKVMLLLIIFMHGSQALVMGLFCAICLIVPASLVLILARKLLEAKIEP